MTRRRLRGGRGQVRIFKAREKFLEIIISNFLRTTYQFTEMVDTW
jgi:hypothetical protein